MTSDEDDTPILTDRALNFDVMSIEDLENYISDLSSEIEKVKQIIKKKQDAHSAANSVFGN